MESESTTSSDLRGYQSTRKRKIPDRFESETNCPDFSTKAKYIKRYNKKKYDNSSEERKKIRTLVATVSKGGENSERFTALAEINNLENPLLIISKSFISGAGLGLIIN